MTTKAVDYLVSDSSIQPFIANIHRDRSIFNPSAFARSLIDSSLRVRALAICFRGMPFLASVLLQPDLPERAEGRWSRVGGGVRSGPLPLSILVFGHWLILHGLRAVCPVLRQAQH